jgi:hypothetical protein
MDTLTPTADHSSLRRQISRTPSPSSFIPSGSAANAEEKRSSWATTKTTDPMIIDLTADSYDDEAIPQRKFNFNARMGIPVIVDMASGGGSEEPSPSPTPNNSSRVQNTPKLMFDRSFYSTQAASTDLPSTKPTSEKAPPPTTTIKSLSTQEYRFRPESGSADSMPISPPYQALPIPEHSTNLRPFKQEWVAYFRQQ